MVSIEFLKGATRGLREECMEGNLKGYYLRLIPVMCLRGQTELVGKFKMVAGDKVSIRGQVTEYT